MARVRWERNEGGAGVRGWEGRHQRRVPAGAPGKAPGQPDLGSVFLDQLPTTEAHFVPLPTRP